MSSSLGKEILGILKLQIALTAIGFATQVFLARYLGPEGKGVLDLFLLIPTVLASLVDFGLLSANSYFSGKRLIDGKVLHANSAIWSVFIGGLLVVFAWAFQTDAAGVFQNLESTAILLSILLVAPTLFFSLWSALMYGSDRVRSVYQFSTFASLIMLLCYLLLGVGFGADVNVFLYASAGALILKSAVAFFLFDLPSLHEFKLDVAALKASFRYGIALYVGLALNMLHFRIGQFFVNSLSGSADLAFYALAVRIAEMIWILDYAIINTSIFRITASEHDEAVRITQRMTRLIGTVVLSGCIIVGLAAPFALPLLFGEAFAPSVIPLVLLLPGILAWSLSRSLAQFVAYQKGKPWESTKAAAIAFVANVALNALLIPSLGIAGASLASTVSYACGLLVIARVFRRISGVPLYSTFVPTREDFSIAWQILSKNTFVSIPERN